MSNGKGKVIISCAVTGSAHTPTMSDALPVTPEEIAHQSIDAAAAGAAILHLHARVPEDGRPTGDPEVYAQFLPVIRQAQLEQCFWKRHFCSMTCTHRRECYHYIFGFG